MDGVQPLRLLVVATAMVAVLALVAGFAATSDRVERDRTLTGTTPAPGPAPRVKDLTASLPSRGGRPIRMRVGDTLTLNVVLPEDDTLEVPDFGVEEPIAGGIRTQVLITAPTVGTYRLHLQDADRDIGELQVLPARTSTEPAPATPEPTTPAAPSSALGTPS
jgi:hypothetical protein